MKEKTFQPLNPEAIRVRFGLASTQAARAFIRKHLPHTKAGRKLNTSEEWLLRWAAQHVKHPPMPKRLDPLQESVHELALNLMESLCRRGVCIKGEMYQLVLMRKPEPPE